MATWDSTTFHQQTIKHWARTPQGQDVLCRLGAAIYYAALMSDEDEVGTVFGALSHVEQLYFEQLAKDAIAEARERFTGQAEVLHAPVLRLVTLPQPRDRT